LRAASAARFLLGDDKMHALIISMLTITLVGSSPSIHKIELLKYQNFRPNFEPKSSKVIPLQKTNKSLSRTVFGRYPYWRGTRYTSLRFDLLTHISWFAIELDAQGNISNWHGWPSQWTDLINLAHQNGVAVTVSVACMDADDIDSIILNPQNRARALGNIVSAVVNAGVEGVTIDFEYPHSWSRDAFTDFMRELRDTLKALDSSYIVSYDLFALDDYWSDHFDQAALAEICDFVYVMAYDYHWSGAEESGPVSPLIGYQNLNVMWTLEHFTSTSPHPERYLLGVPYYGYDWPISNPYPHAPTTSTGTSKTYAVAIDEATAYGKLWDHEGESPWYRYGDHQVWFEDSLSLAMRYWALLRYGWGGIGIWALTYDYGRDELWNLIDRYFNHEISGTPPARPRGFAVRNIGGQQLRLVWPHVDGAEGYRIYEFENNDFVLIADVADTECVLGPFADEIHRFALTAYNSDGESDFTEILEVAVSDTPVQILLVDGVERQRGTWNTRNFTFEHGDAIHANGFAFDAASNDMLRLGIVEASDYELIDWILGEEGTVDSSLTPDEQLIVAQYLMDGGMLFISGSEIGYDLVQRGSSSDQYFYNNYLLARYVGDDANSHSVYGIAGEMFDGLTFSFDDGTHGHYDVDYPDGIDGYGGSRVVLAYQGGTGWGAGIAYNGVFPNGSNAGAIVYLGFPFETVYPEAARNLMMQRILGFFGFTGIEESETGQRSGRIFLRFDPSYKTLRFEAERDEEFDIEVYDVSGRRRIGLKAFGGTASVDISQWPSGIYIYKVRFKDRCESGRFAIIRSRK